jgi:hypothetical protein
MLQYVPCQAIQDRRACHSIRQDCKFNLIVSLCVFLFSLEYFLDDHYSPYQLLKNVNFYIGIFIDFYF